MMTHQDIDRRSLALHRLAVEKIRNNPALFEVVRDNLAKMRQETNQNTKSYLDEWENHLKSGLETVLSVAEEDSYHARCLRQASPFAGVLTEEERLTFLKKWKEEHAN